MRAVVGVLITGIPLVTSAPVTAAAPPVASMSITAVPAPVSSVGQFEAHLRISDGLAGDVTLTASVKRDPVTDRSVYRSSLESFALVPAKSRRDYSSLLSAVPRADTGDYLLRIPISDDPDSPDLTLAVAGVYPVQVRLLDGTGAVLAEVRTNLIRLPSATSPTVPLRVATVMPISAPTQADRSGAASIGDGDLTTLATIITALRTAPTVPMTLVPRPQTLEVLSGTGHGDLVTALRGALNGRQVVSGPFVGLNARSLDTNELRRQLDAGSATLTQLLGTSGTAQTWVVGARSQDATSVTGVPAMDATLAGTLNSLRIQHLVVPDGALTPSATSDPAAWFELDSTSGTIMPSAAVDEFLVRRLQAPGDPVARMSDLLGELAIVWLADPNASRGVVLMPSADWKPESGALESLLSALGTESFLRPVTLDDYFATVSPLSAPASDGGNEPVVRTFNAIDPPTDSSGYLTRVTLDRADLNSLGEMMPGRTDTMKTMAHTTILSSSSDIDSATRDAMLQNVEDQLAGFRNAVLPLDSTRTSILSRNEIIRVRIPRARQESLRVLVKLEGDKLEFPGGTSKLVTLDAPITTLDVAVRVRTSGSLVMRLRFLTPDGRIEVGQVATVHVRSLAVSGLGLVISIGALVFLAYWWSRDWRAGRSRRRSNAAALTAVLASDPAGAGPDPVAGTDAEPPTPERFT
jgi:hypothetical protein